MRELTRCERGVCTGLRERVLHSGRDEVRTVDRGSRLLAPAAVALLPAWLAAILAAHVRPAVQGRLDHRTPIACA